MKTITIHTRKILSRTKFKDYRFKEVGEYVINYDGKRIANTAAEVGSPILRKPFTKALETRSVKKLSEYIQTLRKTNSDKELKKELEAIIEKEGGKK